MRRSCNWMTVGALALLTKASAAAGPERSSREEAQAALARATQSVQAAVPRAASDPTRPVFHFRAPACWMNDPNGPIYHKGYYHVFYQHNPYGDRWGNMHWGHARSRDLVFWEHLPIALWPSKSRGEDHCFSGCAVINDAGQPVIFYTSIGPQRRPRDSAEQWAALGDENLIHWKKHPSNPILTSALHGDLEILDWRDPFVFRQAGTWFMVVGGHRAGGRGCVALYSSDNLMDWKFLGIPFEGTERNWECPNFFKLGDRWVLVYSPHDLVRYYTGNFDLNTYKFTPEYHGTLDRGRSFYAPNCLRDPIGRRILWGWVRGFPEDRGWNGCLTLPRVLTLREDGGLGQRPVREVRALRRAHDGVTNVPLNNESRVIHGAQGDGLEILAVFEPGDAKSFGLELRHLSEKPRAVRIQYTGKELAIGEDTGEFRLREGENRLRLRVFVDRSVIEVYANDRACFTSVVEPDTLNNHEVAVFAENGKARLRALDVWSIQPIWPQPATDPPDQADPAGP